MAWGEEQMALRWTMAVAVALLAGHAAADQAPTPRSSDDSASAERNAKEGEAFLAANKTKEGVVTLESGLQYKILKAGDGKKPALADTVVVHYRGTLVDGTEFGSSYRNGRPGTFPLRAAIEGWRQALQLMPAGSKWQLFVPPYLAYGKQGAGPVGPNATLIFEVELSSGGGAGKPAPTAAAMTGLEVSFKLDPRLTRSLYMGDRWVSPAKFSAPPQGKTSTVEANAKGIDSAGRRIDIDAKWIPGDPEMIEVTKSRGRDVKITVKRAGESKLKVVAQGITKELAIRASEKGEAIAVEIAQ